MVAKPKKIRKKPTSARVDARNLITAEKTNQALQLRRACATYPQIAQQLGCAQAYAHRLVQAGLAALREETKETAEDVLTLEIERLDRRQRRLNAAQDKIEARVKQGEDKAIMLMLKLDASEGNISERRAAYLGLDAPKKTELTGASGGPLALTAIAATPAEAARLVREAFGEDAAMRTPNAAIVEEAFAGDLHGSVPELAPLGANGGRRVAPPGAVPEAPPSE